MSKCNAKLIKYSPSTTKSAFWGAEGNPDREFGSLELYLISLAVYELELSLLVHRFSKDFQ